MKISRIKYNISKLSEEVGLAYRTCVARVSSGGHLECRPLYHDWSQGDVKWTRLEEGSILEGTHHVGTKPEFCLSYYTGMVDLEEGQFEVLLTLEVPKSILPEEDSFMGGEALATNPIVKKINRIDSNNELI